MSSLFDFDKEPDEYAVMGNPISHSKSPLIHSLFSDQTGQRIHYSAIQVDPGGFKQAVGNFFANGGKGLNITVPFKQEAWSLADTLTERATLAGAVNTLKPLGNGQVLGDNTDGIGLTRDIINNLQTVLKGKSILIAGAGGAARGVIGPLLDQRPSRLVIANRSADKAVELARHFNKMGPVEGCGYDDIASHGAFDVVINATSASLEGEIPPIDESAIQHAGLCYDMMYGAKPTVFMAWCQGIGAVQVSDGLGMLVEQAAESFFVWRNVNPETVPVIKQVRQTLSGK